MRGRARILLGFLVAPVAASLFVAGIAGFQSLGIFVTVLAIYYPTAVILGIPAFWFLKAWKLQQLRHFFSAGLIIAVLPGALLYAVAVEPILALTALAGGAVGGIAFWFVALGPSNNASDATR